jgi:hypothetical protein
LVFISSAEVLIAWECCCVLIFGIVVMTPCIGDYLGEKSCIIYWCECTYFYSFL